MGRRTVRIFVRDFESVSDGDADERTPLLRNTKFQSHTEQRKPPFGTSSGPDGSEAWLVALAAWFINFVMAGLGRSSGILYVAMIDIFQKDRRQTSLPFTVRSSMRNLLGPVVGILGQKYGVRPVIIAGAILGTLSAATCFSINDIGWITVVWGGINGASTAMITTLPQVVIGQHFKKCRSTASGIAFSGGCVGSFVFPALIEYLLNTYDLGGTFLLISAFIFHVLPSAIILKPPSWWNKKKTVINRTLANDFERQRAIKAAAPGTLVEQKEEDGFVDHNLPQVESNGIQGSSPLLRKQNTASERQRTLRCDVDSDFLWKNKHLLLKLLTDNSTLPYVRSGSTRSGFYHSDDSFVKEIELLLRQSEKHASNENLYLHADACCIVPASLEQGQKSPGPETVHFSNGDLRCKALNGEVDAISIDYLAYYMEKLLQRDRKDILRYFTDPEQQKTIENILKELENLQDSLTRNGLDAGSNGSVTDSEKRSNSFNAHIRTAFGLYRKLMFLLICLCRATHFMTFVPAVTTVVDFSMDRGLKAEDGKYTIAALSSGDLLGRLCFGWITDYGYVTLPRYMLFVMVLQGCATAAIPAMQSRYTLMLALAVFGLLMGSSFVRHPVLISRYLPEHEQSIAMGCIDLFSGIIGLFLQEFIGYFRDVVGSYDGLYYVNGFISCAVGLCWYFEPFLRKHTPDCDLEESLQTTEV